MRNRFERHCGFGEVEVENCTACNLLGFAETWAVTPLAARGGWGPRWQRAGQPALWIPDEWWRRVGEGTSSTKSGRRRQGLSICVQNDRVGSIGFWLSGTPCRDLGCRAHCSAGRLWAPLATGGPARVVAT